MRLLTSLSYVTGCGELLSLLLSGTWKWRLLCSFPVWRYMSGCIISWQVDGILPAQIRNPLEYLQIYFWTCLMFVCFSGIKLLYSVVSLWCYACYRLVKHLRTLLWPLLELQGGQRSFPLFCNRSTQILRKIGLECVIRFRLLIAYISLYLNCQNARCCICRRNASFFLAPCKIKFM